MKFEEWTALVTASSAAGSVIVFTLVGTIKKFWPKLIEGIEPKIAMYSGLLVGIASGIAAHLQFKEKFPEGWIGWVAAIGSGFVVGLGSGVGGQATHDYAGNALKGGKNEKTDAPGGSGTPPAGGV